MACHRTRNHASDSARHHSRMDNSAGSSDSTSVSPGARTDVGIRCRIDESKPVTNASCSSPRPHPYRTGPPAAWDPSRSRTSSVCGRGWNGTAQGRDYSRRKMRLRGASIVRQWSEQRIDIQQEVDTKEECASLLSPIRLYLLSPLNSPHSHWGRPRRDFRQ